MLIIKARVYTQTQLWSVTILAMFSRLFELTDRISAKFLSWKSHNIRGAHVVELAIAAGFFIFAYGLYGEGRNFFAFFALIAGLINLASLRPGTGLNTRDIINLEILCLSEDQIMNKVRKNDIEATSINISKRFDIVEVDSSKVAKNLIKRNQRMNKKQHGNK